MCAPLFSSLTSSAVANTFNAVGKKKEKKKEEEEGDDECVM